MDDILLFIILEFSVFVVYAGTAILHAFRMYTTDAHIIYIQIHESALAMVVSVYISVCATIARIPCHTQRKSEPQRK